MDTYDLEPFATWMRSWGASTETIAARRAAVRAAIRSHWGDPVATTDEAIGAWLATPGWSGWTRCTYFGHARSFFGWLHESGRRADNPTAGMRPPRSPENVPRPLSPEEAAGALEAASPRQRVWLELGMFAGLRAHEVAKIRGEDVTRDAIHVVGKGGKAAMIPTHSILWTTAQRLPRYGYWFPSSASRSGHVNPKTISTSLTRLFASLGITGSSHRARHTYGTNLLRDGANIRVVQKLMRHDSLASTERYLGVDQDELRAAIGRLAA